MKAFPHHYTVQVALQENGEVINSSSNLPTLISAPPVEFGGPGDHWSPETLLVAAQADCFALSFRAITHASKLSWDSLHCDVEGVLDRVDAIMQFTEFTIQAHLIITSEQDKEKALELLQKAKQTCLISNSLKAHCHLKANVDFSSTH